jgi:uncharacterized circularly permuted ATP-grasp superfamily protein/uncharacterized alpha-E superfamily protein
MPAQPQKSPPALEALLDGYRPAAGAYDELLGPDGALRPGWHPLVERLAGMGEDERRRAQAYADDQLREHDVTFRGADEGGSRPWLLDLVPLQFSAAEWSRLESGLIQRARLLDALVADTLGPQRLLTSGILPPAVHWRGGDFPVPCLGSDAPGHPHPHLHLLAFDLVRDEDGRWRVLRNRVGAPTGLGYALENRIIVSRCLPEAFEQAATRRLAAFFRHYSDHLVSLTGRDDPLCLVLTPQGGRSTDYFEHAFIGRYLGYGVVQGPDLTVRDGRVMLKTVEGLKPVDLLLRRLPTNDCDPLELDVGSVDGVAGLMQAARNGRVIISNQPGSEVGENPALSGFLPQACVHLLGETLEIDDIDSWWCAAPGGLQRAMDEFQDLRFQPVAEPARGVSAGQIVAAALEQSDAARLRGELAARPQDFVAQRLPRVSNAPTLDERGRLRAVPVTVRLYLAATAEGYELMPGGLARVADADGIAGPGRLPNHANKDVWVPRADLDAPAARVPSLLDRPLRLQRSDRNLASRTADNLFWLGIYLERAEGATRLFRALYNAFEGDTPVSAAYSGTDSLANLLVTLEHLSPRRARRLANQGRWLLAQRFFSYVFDTDSADGLVPVLANVARIAALVRERLSPDVWRVIERLCQAPARVGADSVMRNDFGQPLNHMIEDFAAINGMIALNMTRADGWRFLDTGRRLERLRHAAKLIGELATRPGVQESARLGLLLELADCTITYRSRYRSAARFQTTLDLLVADSTNPRALIHQVQVIREHVQALPMDRQNELLSPILTQVLRLEAALRLSELDRLENELGRGGQRRQLVQLTERVQKEVSGLIDQLTITYFNHAVERRLGGQDSVVAL